MRRSLSRLLVLTVASAASAASAAGARQQPQPSPETVLTGVAVLQHCTSADSGCASGPMNELVAIRITRGAAAALERIGPILLVVGVSDTIAAPSAPPASAPATGELSRLLARAGVTAADLLPPAPRAEPAAGAQPMAHVAAALPFARVYARRPTTAQPQGNAVLVFDITALRRQPRFEPTRTVRVIWTGAEGRSYAVVVRVP